MADGPAGSSPAAPAAPPAANAPAGEAERRVAKPIPAGAAPGKPGAAPSGDASPADVQRERDERGRFVTSEGNDLADLLGGGEAIDPRDRAVTDLDGNEPENVVVKATKRKSGREFLAEGAGEGEATGDASPTPDPKAGATGVDGAAGAVVGAADPNAPPPVAPDPSDTRPQPPSDEQLIKLVIDGDEATYKNKAHLQQAVKSLRGMYNAAEKARLDLNTKAHANYAAAQAWRERAERLERGERVDPLNTSATTQPPNGRSQDASPAAGQDAAGRQAASAVADATGAPEERIAAAVNWDHYKVIKETKGAEVAQLWATAQMIAAATAPVSQRIEEMQRPSRELAAEFEIGKKWGETIRVMSDWVNDDQSPTYPELSDDAAISEIGRVLTALKKQGISPEWLQTPRGMHTAIITWRDYRQAQGNPWRPSAQSQPTAPAAPAANSAPSGDGIADAVASVARTLSGRGNAPARPATPRDAREYRIKDAIVSADKNVHGDFPWAS